MGLTMTDVVEVCREVGVEPTADPHGVRVGTTGWRIRTSSGLADNGHMWWISTIAGAYHPTHQAAQDARSPIGPIATRAELRRALRTRWPSLQAKLGQPLAVRCAGCGATQNEHDADPPHENPVTECEGFRWPL